MCKRQDIEVDCCTVPLRKRKNPHDAFVILDGAIYLDLHHMQGCPQLYLRCQAQARTLNHILRITILYRLFKSS